MVVDKKYFPGFVRKAITFTNDDGNLEMDEKFISILKPYGIKGTFNICGIKEGHTPEEYRTLYKGYGIANHCYLHPHAMDDSISYKISDSSSGATDEKECCIYPYAAYDGVYKLSDRPDEWRLIAGSEKYIELIGVARKMINEIFGEGFCSSFVWPFCEQNNKEVKDYLKRSFRSVRKTGCTFDNDGFSLPQDRYAWSYNATHQNLLEIASIFEKYEDDGELKFFSFGLHSIDYERNEKWADLESFAKRYGNRPEDFYYASVDEIFDYEDAINSLVIEESSVLNNSDITVYIKIDGEPVILKPHSLYRI